MGTAVETAKAAKVVLKREFPCSKFSVTSSLSSIWVCWSDDGPTVKQVQDILLAAGYAEAKTAWNGDRYLKVPGNDGSYLLDCYNADERAAKEQRREQERAEHEAQQQRENKAVAAASRAKNNALASVEWQRPPSIKDQAAFDAFERLRLRAEGDLAADVARSRRPTWAPPMVLGEELGELCYSLKYITDDERWIGRLWATFASPKRSGGYLREHTSTLPLKGIRCRGFQFYPGEARKPTHQILFEAQRTETGEWQFGPSWWPASYRSPRACEWESLVRDCERQQRYATKYPNDPAYPAQIADLTHKIETIDAEDLKHAQDHRDRQQLHARVLELARARVLDFIGAPDVQMQIAGRLWGHCCICGKALTDPISLERGIGPDCYGHLVDRIRNEASWLQEQGRPADAEAVAAGTLLPLSFVTEVLSEAGQRYGATA